MVEVWYRITQGGTDLVRRLADQSSRLEGQPELMLGGHVVVVV